MLRTVYGTMPWRKNAQRISPFNDDFCVFADEVVFAEDEQRPIAHSLEAQATEKPLPWTIARHRRGGKDPRRGLVATGERRPWPGDVCSGVADPGSSDRWRPNNNVHHRVESSFDAKSNSIMITTVLINVAGGLGLRRNEKVTWCYGHCIVHSSVYLPRNGPLTTVTVLLWVTQFTAGFNVPLDSQTAYLRVNERQTNATRSDTFNAPYCSSQGKLYRVTSVHHRTVNSLLFFQ